MAKTKEFTPEEQEVVNSLNSCETLAEVGRFIRRNWANVWFGAVPYLQAMCEIDAPVGDKRAMYGYDSAQSIVLYFLGNAAQWKGTTARITKAFLKARY